MDITKSAITNQYLRVKEEAEEEVQPRILEILPMLEVYCARGTTLLENLRATAALMVTKNNEETENYYACVDLDALILHLGLHQ